MPYQNILVAVDLGATTETIIRRAAALARQDDAELHVLHVIEPLAITYGGDIPMDISHIQDQIHETAEKHLREFAKYLDVEKSDQHLIFGRPESEIHALAYSIGADLIVVGSHGRHGLALLLGSTANGVLQGAPCDVLAIRVCKKE